MSDLQSLLDQLDRASDERRWCTGYQLCVMRDGAVVVDRAGGVDGFGREVTADDLFAIYCAGKPVTALAIGRLIELGELSFDDRLVDLIDRPLDPTLGVLTVDQLLTHRAGLHRHAAMGFLAMSPQARADAVVSLRARTHDTEAATYAEFAGWELLGLVLESLTGTRFAEHVELNVLRPMGVAHSVTFELRDDDPRRSSFRVNVDLAGGRPVPLLWENSSDNLCAGAPASGAVASMRGLAEFYDRLAQAYRSIAIDGVSAQTIHSLVDVRTEIGDDPVLGRRCQMGRGFMVDLVHHDFGTLVSPQSFGHSGLNGMTFAGADPTTGLAWAVHLNAITAHVRDSDDLDVSAQARRRHVMDVLLSV